MTDASSGLQPSLAERMVLALRVAVVVAMAAAFLYYVYCSIHWAIMSDSAVMHYVRLLLDRGLRPYGQISDSNMPGAYLTEGWGMSVFGYSDLGWRLYDYCLVAVMTGAMITIARPYDWVAGVYAAGLFTAMHGAEGPMYSVEREQVILVLFLVAYAALFTSLRRRLPALAGACGLAGGIAGSIKPQFAPLALVLAGFAAFAARRNREAATPYVAWELGGVAAAGALDLWVLVSRHAVRGFWFISRRILPAYVGTSRETFARMMHLLMIRSVLLLLLAAVVLAVAAWLRRDRLAWEEWGWERWSLVVGAAYGLFSFFLQGKGYVHHRYFFLAILLLLLGLEFMTALRRPGWRRWLAAAAVLASLALVPRTLVGMHRAVAENGFSVQLQRDLTVLGGTRELQGRVLCFDITDGCLDALYHLRLTGNTGFTGDLMLFSDTRGMAVDFYRNELWELQRQDPADVLVLSNQWYEHDNSFGKIDRWPEFARYLAANYTMVAERSFPQDEPPQRSGVAESGGPEAYRIYVRNGSALLGRAAGLGSD